eukprot:scaffold5918_cov124-Isochrysis_galbana.AAC.15
MKQRAVDEASEQGYGRPLPNKPRPASSSAVTRPLAFPLQPGWRAAQVRPIADETSGRATIQNVPHAHERAKRHSADGSSPTHLFTEWLHPKQPGKFAHELRGSGDGHWHRCRTAGAAAADASAPSTPTTIAASAAVALAAPLAALTVALAAGTAITLASLARPAVAVAPATLVALTTALAASATSTAAASGASDTVSLLEHVLSKCKHVVLAHLGPEDWAALATRIVRLAQRQAHIG